MPKEKYIYTVVTPEGPEVVLGVFANDRAAKSSFARKYPADWRSLTSGPLRQRPPKKDERVKEGTRWTTALARKAGLAEDYIGGLKTHVPKIVAACKKAGNRHGFIKEADGKSQVTAVIYFLFKTYLRDMKTAKALWDLFEHGGGPSLDASRPLEQLARTVWGNIPGDSNAERSVRAAALSVMMLRSSRQPRMAAAATKLFERTLKGDIEAVPALGKEPSATPAKAFNEAVGAKKRDALTVWKSIGQVKDRAIAFVGDLLEDVNWHSVARVFEGEHPPEEDTQKWRQLIHTLSRKYDYSLEPVAEFGVALLRAAGKRPLALALQKAALSTFPESYGGFAKAAWHKFSGVPDALIRKDPKLAFAFVDAWSPSMEANYGWKALKSVGVEEPAFATASDRKKMLTWNSEDIRNLRYKSKVAFSPAEIGALFSAIAPTYNYFSAKRVAKLLAPFKVKIYPAREYSVGLYIKGKPEDLKAISSMAKSKLKADEAHIWPDGRLRLWWD